MFFIGSFTLRNIPLKYILPNIVSYILFLKPGYETVVNNTADTSSDLFTHGVALANYQNFIALGFNLVALFDNDPNIIGKTVNHVKVKSIDELQSCAKNLKIDIGVIAVPAQFAQQVADKLVKANIKGIWNFAPVKMRVPEDVKIVNEDLSVGLSRLSYYIRQVRPH